ncbi:MAG: RES family NAD+ phosphorylase [Opitutales bacterium]
MSRTVQAWRLVKKERAHTAFDGEGAFRFGGRWNHRGQRVVYASSTLALALLEILVHIDPTGHVPELVAITIEIPVNQIETGPRSSAKSLSEGLPWPLSKTRQTGDAWMRTAKKPVLQVPSAIVQVEQNYLINPEHRDFDKIEIGPAEVFTFDPRLIAL